MRCLEMPEAVNHPDRPTGPLKRAGERGENKWESVTWDEAYDIIEEKVRAIWKDYGAESIACMIGTGRNNCWQIPYLCYAAFGSPNFCLGFLSGESCFQPRSAAMASMNGDFLIADMSQQFESRYDTENTEWVPPEDDRGLGVQRPSPRTPTTSTEAGSSTACSAASRLITVDPSLTWLAARSDYLAAPAPRHRRRARPGHAQRHHLRGPLRPRVRREVVLRLRRACRARQGMDAGAGGGGVPGSEGHHNRGGARLREGQARHHPLGPAH